MKLCADCRYGRANGNDCPLEKMIKGEHCDYYKSDLETKVQRKKNELSVLNARLKGAIDEVEYLKIEIAAVERS